MYLIITDSKTITQQKTKQQNHVHILRIILYVQQLNTHAGGGQNDII